MSERDDLFDDANGCLAMGELEEAAALYRRCTEIDPEFFDDTFVESWMDAQARQDPRLADAWPLTASLSA